MHPSVLIPFVAIGCAYPRLEMGPAPGGSGSSPRPSPHYGGSALSSLSTATVPSGGQSFGSSNIVTASDPGSGGVSSPNSSAPPSSGGIASSDSADSTALGGTWTNSGTGASGSVGTGGTSISTASLGGAGGTGGVSTGGTSTSTASLGGAGSLETCPASVDLVSLAISGNQTIGGDFAKSTDDPCGVQGKVFVFSDKGPDAVACTSDDSLIAPACVGSGEDPTYANPCTGGKCCVSGKTPADSFGNAGFGFFLAMDSNWTAKPYLGPAKGFSIKTSGTLNGQSVQIQYMKPSGEYDPEVRLQKLGERLEFLFDATCGASSSCRPLLLQFNLISDRTAGEFLLCVDSVTPIT